MKKILFVLLAFLVVLAVACAPQAPLAEPEGEVADEAPAEEVAEPEPAPEPQVEGYEPSDLQPVEQTGGSSSDTVVIPEAKEPMPMDDSLHQGRIVKITSKRADHIAGKIKDLETTRVHAFTSNLVILHSRDIVTFKIDANDDAVEVSLEKADERENEQHHLGQPAVYGNLVAGPGERLVTLKVDGASLIPRSDTFRIDATALDGAFRRFKFISPVWYKRGDILLGKLNVDDEVVESVKRGY